MINPHVNLWPHQLAAIESCQLAIGAGLGRGLVVLPTGTGKTVTFLSLARHLGWPTLVLVHRDRLITQTLRSARRVWPEAAYGVIKGNRNEWAPFLYNSAPNLVVASVQSLHERRMAGIPAGRFKLVIADEAHHAPSPSWSRVLEFFRSDFRLGVTATPSRLDKKGLATWFGPDPLYTYSLFAAIADGHLCEVDSRAVDTKLDLSALGVVSDFKLQQLAKAVNTTERNKQVVEAWHKHASDRRAVAFCVDVDHAEDLAQEFANSGAKAAAVHSKQTDRQNDEILDGFAAGKLQVVCSCESLTEGYDDPGISCLLMARPTLSRALYVQMVGRGLRKADGKADCLVIDFTDNYKKHKLACSYDLFGKHKRAVASAIDTEPATPRDPKDPESTPILSWKLQEACPWPELPSLEEYVPLWPSDEEPASAGQLRYLKSFGLGAKDGLTRGECSYLIERCKEFDACFPKPASDAQRRLLEHAGIWRDGMSKRQASVMIDNLKRLEKARAR